MFSYFDKLDRYLRESTHVHIELHSFLQFKKYGERDKEKRGNKEEAKRNLANRWE